MQSTSTTAHPKAPHQDGKVLHCIWSRSLKGSLKHGQKRAARCILLIVTGAALTLPLSNALAKPAPKTAAKNTKSTLRRTKANAKKRLTRRTVSGVVAKSPVARLKPASRYMEVGGVLARPADNPALLQVKTTAIPAAANVTITRTALAQAPGETAPVVAPTVAPTTPVPVTPVPVAPAPVAPSPATPVAPETPAVPVAPATPAPPVVPVTPETSGTPASPVSPGTADTTPPEAELSAAEAVGNQATALRGLGEIRRRQQRYEEAVDFFRRATLLDPGDIKARVGLSQSLRGLKNFQEALVESEKALALEPTNLAARVIHAQLLDDNNRPDEAAKELDAIVTSLPDKPTAETYTALAQAFVGLHNFDAALQILGRGQQDYPEDAFIARNRAEALTYAKRWDEATAAWDSLIAADPQDADAYLGKARIYNYSSREEMAEPLYRRVLEIEPENYQARVELADIVGRRGNWPEAITLYRAALEKNKGDLPTRVELARVLRYSGRYEEAEQELNQVIGTDAKFAPALTERGILRGQNKKYDLAIADLMQALKLTPGDVYAQFGLAEVLGYNKNYEESINLYREALQREPDNQKGRVQLGLVLSYASRGEEALKEFDTVLAANPSNVSAQIGKADTLARLQRYPESIALYETLLKNDPNNRRANAGLAEAYVYAKQYTQAIAIYDRLLASDPNDVNAAIDRGRTFGYAGMHREAAKALRPIVAAHPENLDARLYLAEALTNSGERPMREEAIGHYKVLLETDPNNMDARLGLGRVLSYQGRTREAQAELQRVIAARPNDPDAYYALAETQRYAKPFDAKANYEKALQLGAKGYNANRASLALRELRRETRPSLDLSYRRYTDTNGVRLTEYGGGPVVRTRAGTIGASFLTGTYQDDGVSQSRRALNLMLARKLGSISARLMLQRVSYGTAPNRNLFDLALEKAKGERKRFWANLGRDEIIESLGATNAGITRQVYRAGVEWPLGDHFDLDLEGRYFRYSDGNRRTTWRPSIYYRLRPTSPSLRFGLGYVSDNTRFLSPIPTPYYTPQDYKTFVALADYVKTVGRTRYGVFLAHPLSENTGIGGVNRPADTLFGFLNYDVNEALQLFVNGGIVRGPNFDSDDITGGLRYWF